MRVRVCVRVLIAIAVQRFGGNVEEFAGTAPEPCHITGHALLRMPCLSPKPYASAKAKILLPVPVGQCGWQIPGLRTHGDLAWFGQS